MFSEANPSALVRSCRSGIHREQPILHRPKAPAQVAAADLRRSHEHTKVVAVKAVERELNRFERVGRLFE